LVWQWLLHDWRFDLVTGSQQNAAKSNAQNLRFIKVHRDSLAFIFRDYTVLAPTSNCMDAAVGGHDNPAMARYTFPAFTTSTRPRYIVLWDLQWHVIDCQRLVPAADLSGAMAAAIARLEGVGWQAEATPEYGFVFVRRASDRRLLMLTERDPHCTAAQSFNPFR
jgi:hypothetical protein